jgi:hypothetical protein
MNGSEQKNLASSLGCLRKKKLEMKQGAKADTKPVCSWSPGTTKDEEQKKRKISLLAAAEFSLLVDTHYLPCGAMELYDEI